MFTVLAGRIMACTKVSSSGRMYGRSCKVVVLDDSVEFFDGTTPDNGRLFQQCLYAATGLSDAPHTLVRLPIPPTIIGPRDRGQADTIDNYQYPRFEPSSGQSMARH